MSDTGAHEPRQRSSRTYGRPRLAGAPSLRRAPLAYGAAKRLVALAADTDLRSGILAESLAQTALLGSEDHREGLAAAREKREPEFAGR